MTTKTEHAATKPVLVRTYSAGVHFGHMTARDGKEVTLEKSRRGGLMACGLAPPRPILLISFCTG